jgi:hypothetical protein
MAFQAINQARDPVVMHLCGSALDYILSQLTTAS